jgi:intein/homing endonuclease
MKYETNEQFFDKWSPEMAYILGLIITDGYVNSFGVHIDLKTDDVSVLEFIKSQISPNRPIYEYQKIDKRNGSISKYNRLAITSVKLMKSLENFGVYPKKTGFEIMPETPPSMKSHLLRGIFDGDGSVRIRNRVRKNLVEYKEYELKFSSASEVFLKSIKSFCENKGGGIKLEMDKRPNRTMPYYRYVMGRKDGAILRDFMYFDAKSFLKRKKILLDQF